MDNETKKLLGVVGVALILLWLFKPKNSIMSSPSLKGDGGGGSGKYAAPKMLDPKEAKEQHDAYVGIQAMRDAVENGESRKELEKLNRMIFNEHGVKVYVMTNGKFCARNRKGKTIAKES